MNKTTRMFAGAAAAVVAAGTAAVLIASSTAAPSTPLEASRTESIRSQAKSEVVDMGDWRETAVPKRGSSRSNP